MARIKIFINSLINNIQIIFLIPILMLKYLYTIYSMDYHLLKLSFIFYMAAISTVIIIVGFILIFKVKIRFIIWVIINLVISIIIFSDIVYFRYYGDVVTIPYSRLIDR